MIYLMRYLNLMRVGCCRLRLPSCAAPVSTEALAAVTARDTAKRMRRRLSSCCWSVVEWDCKINRVSSHGDDFV